MDTKEKAENLARHTNEWLFQHWDILVTGWLLICLVCGGIWYHLRWISPEEQALRQAVVSSAEQWLGAMESDGSHQPIIDRYNACEPNPRNYKVSYDDNWCATFASVAALDSGLTDIIPMECSCQEQINLFMNLDSWQEDDRYLPRTGDYIYYVWDEWRRGDCTAWAGHVGIVAETFGPVIKVIEGNKDDAVGYRYIFLNDITIRGYGIPDYGSLCK